MRLKSKQPFLHVQDNQICHTSKKRKTYITRTFKKIKIRPSDVKSASIGSLREPCISIAQDAFFRRAHWHAHIVCDCLYFVNHALSEGAYSARTTSWRFTFCKSKQNIIPFGLMFSALTLKKSRLHSIFITRFLKKAWQKSYVLHLLFNPWPQTT